MQPAPFRVVLDACVLYPFTVRDVLLQAAANDFYQAYWSATILDEAVRNLIADQRISAENAERLKSAMRSAFPESEVTDYEHLIPAMRNDPKDRHVVAAAVKAGAQVIVTSNRRDFFDLPSGIEVQSPDQFLSNLFDLDPPNMLRVFDALARRYRKPPRTIARILESLALPELGRLLTALVETRARTGSSALEGAARGGDVLHLVDGGDRADRGGAGGVDLMRRRRRHAADGDDGDLAGGAHRRGEARHADDGIGVLLGTGGEHRAEAEVVGAPSDGGRDLLERVRGDADGQGTAGGGERRAGTG